MRKSKWTFVGAVVTATAALMIVNVSPAQGDPGKDPETVSDTATTVDPGRAPDQAVSARVASAAATSALATLHQRIYAYVAYNGSKYTFGSYVDANTNTIVLDTDAPMDVVGPLINLPTVNSTNGSPIVQAVKVNKLTTHDAWNRRDDIPPFYGGGGIAAGGSICSSGYAVKIATGARFMVTAGHCWANGTAVRTESGATPYGTVLARRLPTVTGHPMDVEVLGGSSYAGRIFTGGVTSSTSIPVVAAGSAVVGYGNYCHSGRTTGEQCGHTATSTTAQVCTATGCKWPVIAYTGGVIQQPGDSGGPFYAKDASGAWIRGHVIASSATTGYVEPWTVVSSALGVSIVTG
jgi:hypothetical protein